MEQTKQLVKCDACSNTFPIDQIEIYQRIVRKENIIAIAYCFRCPVCGQEYICYFKDSEVNRLFESGNAKEARFRMEYLRELFTDGDTV